MFKKDECQLVQKEKGNNFKRSNVNRTPSGTIIPVPVQDLKAYFSEKQINNIPKLLPATPDKVACDKHDQRNSVDMKTTEMQSCKSNSSEALTTTQTANHDEQSSELQSQMPKHSNWCG